MPSCLKDYLIILSAGLCLSTSVPAASDAAENFTLLSRSTAGHTDVQLEPSQRQWAQDKRELILGTSAPDYPPFDMTVSGQDYEGITADYAGILAKALGLPIKVQSFATREA